MQIRLDGLELQLVAGGQLLGLACDDATKGLAALRGSEVPEMAEAVVEAANGHLQSNEERLEAVSACLRMLEGPIPDLWAALAKGDHLLAAGAAFHSSSSVRRQAAASEGLPLMHGAARPIPRRAEPRLAEFAVAAEIPAHHVAAIGQASGQLDSAVA